MNKVTAKDGTVTYKRITKREAKKLWEEGKEVHICPVKLSPFGPWQSSMRLFKNENDLPSRNFDYLVKNFVWFNCNLNETGYYSAFYAPIN